MNLKKTVSFILTVALILTAVFAVVPTANAANVDVSLSVKPGTESLKEGGDVEFAISIQNSGDVAIEEAKLTYEGEVLTEVGNINAGNTKNLTETINVPTSKLGDTLAFSVEFYYTDDTGERRQDEEYATAKVAKKASNIKVGTSVKVDKDSVSPGGKVKFTFTVENQGDVEITDAAVSASVLNSGNRIGDKFSLDPGESKSVTYTGTFNKTVTVKPVVKYTADGKSHSANFDSKKISVTGDADLHLEFSSDKEVYAPGEEATFKLYVENAGDVLLSNIKVFDYNGQRVDSARSELSPGESFNVEKKVAIQNGGELQFTVEATDQNGKTHSFTSNAIIVSTGESSPSASISPSPSASENVLNEETFVIEVTSENMTMEEPGLAKINMKITNNSNMALNNVVVEEATLGKITEDITSIEPGQEVNIENIEINVEETTVYQFVITGYDAAGEKYEFAADPFEITVGAENAGSGMSTILIIIIVVIVLIIVIGVVLIVLVRKEKKKQNGGISKGKNGTNLPKSNMSRPGVNGNRPQRPTSQRPSNQGGRGVSSTERTIQRPRPMQKPSSMQRPKDVSEDKPRNRFDDRNNF